MKTNLMVFKLFKIIDFISIPADDPGELNFIKDCKNWGFQLARKQFLHQILGQLCKTPFCLFFSMAAEMNHVKSFMLRR